MDDVFEARLAPFVAEVLRRQRAPGLALAIVSGGRVAYARGFGVTDLDAPSPVGADTIFPAASITKTFTGAAVLRLVERGAIALGDPVARHLPPFRLDDPRAAGITVRHLLTHTSGMPDSDPLDVWDDPQLDDDALERYVRGLSGRWLEAEPGARRRYCNDGFEVLGALVARVSGERFEDHIERTLLGPLGMRASRMMPRRAAAADEAAGHVLDRAGGVARWPRYTLSRSHAASGTLTTTAADLARWLLALLGRGELDGASILDPGTLALAFAPAVPFEEDSRISQGLAFRVYEHRGHRAVGHGGWDIGFRCGMTLLPDAGLGVVIMTNFHWTAVLDLIHAALDVALGLEPEPALPEPASLSGWAGVLERPGERAALDVEGGELWLRHGGARRRLTPLGRDVFVVSEGKGKEPAFVRRREGEVVLEIGGATLTRPAGGDRATG